MPRAAAAPDRRRNHVDLVAAEEAVLAAMRIERRNGDPRRGNAGAAHRRIGEADHILDPLPADLLERAPQRDVRRDARHPQAVEHVHLAVESVVPRHLREHLVLVAEAEAARVQRGLVQRCERDRVDPSGKGQLDHRRKRLACEAT